MGNAPLGVEHCTHKCAGRVAAGVEQSTEQRAAGGRSGVEQYTEQCAPSSPPGGRAIYRAMCPVKPPGGRAIYRAMWKFIQQHGSYLCRRPQEIGRYLPSIELRPRTSFWRVTSAVTSAARNGFSARRTDACIIFMSMLMSQAAHACKENAEINENVDAIRRINCARALLLQ